MFKKLLIASLVYLLVVIPVVGCKTATGTPQSQINTAVQNVETWAPIVATDAAALISSIAQFSSPADAAKLQTLVVQIQQDVTPIQALCAAYLANPSAGILAQITAAINNANTASSSALLAALDIKDPNSQATAKAALAAIATALTILTTYFSAAGQPVSITLPAGYKLDKGIVTQALNEAKEQRLLASNVTAEQVMAELTKRGIVKFA